MSHAFPTDEAIDQLLGICANVDADERSQITRAMATIDRQFETYDQLDRDPPRYLPGTRVFRSQIVYPDAPADRWTIDVDPIQADFEIVNFRPRPGGFSYTIRITAYRFVATY
jgi:hypothetical protein